MADTHTCTHLPTPTVGSGCPVKGEERNIDENVGVSFRESQCRIGGEDVLAMLREVFTLCQTHRFILKMVYHEIFTRSKVLKLGVAYTKPHGSPPKFFFFV